jgi:hypothetical protein
MIIDEIKQALAAAHLPIIKEERLSNATGMQLHLFNGAIINCFDNGNHSVQGENRRTVERALAPATPPSSVGGNVNALEEFHTTPITRIAWPPPHEPEASTDETNLVNETKASTHQPEASTDETNLVNETKASTHHATGVAYIRCIRCGWRVREDSYRPDSVHICWMCLHEEGP